MYTLKFNQIGYVVTYGMKEYITIQLLDTRFDFHLSARLDLFRNLCA